MAQDVFVGPIVTMGPCDATATLPTGNTGTRNVGPNIAYKADSLLDIRYSLNKDNDLKGAAIAHFLNAPHVMCDAIPSTYHTNTIAAAQAAVASTPLTLAAKSTGIATAIPFYQFGTSTLITANMALDFGFDTLNVTAASKTATVGNSALYKVGMPLVVANVGNAAATTALLTFVTATPSATTITLNDAPLASNAAAPVGTGNNWGPQGLGTIVPTAAMPYFEDGFGRFWDPRQGISRGISITTGSSATGGTLLVSGYDTYGQPQSELINAAASSTTYYGLKTYRFIQSVVPTFSDSGANHTYAVGTSDVYGCNLRSDEYEWMDVCWAGANMTSSTGWVTADQTSPATTTTGDVRGTIQVSAIGGGSGIGTTDSNGSNRLSITMLLNTANISKCNPNNLTPIYGQTPV